MADYRAIMQQVLDGRSYAEIVQVVGCSRRDVALVRGDRLLGDYRGPGVVDD